MASGQLASFALKNVLGLDTGEKRGSGAYGAVYKVTIDGVPCIAKRLHDILVDPEVPRRQRASIQQKFLGECTLLSQLRHPNVVHFVGVHYGRNRDDMSLIMECLDTDLARCLETQPNIPIEVKLLILLDVSYGLLYLHTHSPQIIHRDLTAANILLTRDKRAKIADLGVSKLLDPRTRAAVMQTKAPGTHFYMPPEALMENPKYDEKLDIFSFGHLALYVINQDFPEVFEVPITSAVLRDHDETLQILKRRKAIDEMGRHHCLHDVVAKCLQDNPQKRPTTLKLSDMLNRLCMKHPREHQDVIELTAQLSAKDQQVTVIADWNDRLQEQVKQHKKEVDKYMKEAGAHKQYAEIQTDKVMTLTRESEEKQSRAEMEVQKERSEKEAIERELVRFQQDEYQHLQREMSSMTMRMQYEVQAAEKQVMKLTRESEERQSRAEMEVQKERSEKEAIKRETHQVFQHLLMQQDEYQHLQREMSSMTMRMQYKVQAAEKQIVQLTAQLSAKDQQVTAIASENDRLQEQVKQHKKEVEKYMKEAGAHKQYAEIQTEKNERLQEEVLSKMQQYKNHVDQYKEEIRAHKRAAEIQSQLNAKFAQDTKKWQSRAAEWKTRVQAEARKDRSRSQAFERQIAELEQDQLQQESYLLPKPKVVPKAVADNTSVHSKLDKSALAQFFPVLSTDYDEPPTISTRAHAAPLGSTKPSVSATSHTPSPRVGVRSVHPTEPSTPDTIRGVRLHSASLRGRQEGREQLSQCVVT